MLWTEKISLGTIRDPLQLAVFRYSESYFISGIITQTQRLRYYTFLTWAWATIKERKSDLKKNEITDLEKILTLASAIHHSDGSQQPNGISNFSSAMEQIQKNKTIDLQKYQNFGRNNNEGWGNYYYRGSLKNLDILWLEDDSIHVSPAGKEISKIFSSLITDHRENLWKKLLSHSQLEAISPICCCNMLPEEQDFWIKILFGLTTNGKSGLETLSGQKITLKEPDELSFDKFQLSEDQIIESELDEVLTNDESKSDDTSKEMRKGTLFLILKIIKETSPASEKNSLLQTIRDAIYHSEFTSTKSIKPIKFDLLESYRKYWEVYVHNTYYINALESTLSLITEICRENPLGISVDDLTCAVDNNKYFKSIQKLGFTISQDDTVDMLFDQLKKILNNKDTSLSNPLNENKILKSLIDSDNDSDILAMTLILLLLCRHRFTTFDDNRLRILSYKHDKFASVLPENIYQQMSQIKIADFAKWLFHLIIKRHRHISSKKLLNQGTKSWLFTVEGNEVFFNEFYDFNPYRDGKWINVLEIMSDLGLVQKNSSEKQWSITKKGEEWLEQI